MVKMNSYLSKIRKYSFYTIVVVFLVATMVSIGACDDKTTSKEGVNVELKSLDSIHNIIAIENKPSEVSQVIHQYIKDLRYHKGYDELAKKYYIIANYFMLIFDYDKADVYINKLRRLFAENKNWNKYVSLSKTIAMSYRIQKRYDDMERVLRDAIEVAKKHNVMVYDLMPIHELAVFYSYDVEKHKKAIKYGELFFNKLHKYDSLNIHRDAMKSLKSIEVYVMNLVLGRSYVEENFLDKAYVNLSLAEKEYTKKNDKEKLERVHSNFINYYLKKKNLEKIKEHKQKYFEFQKQHKDSLVSSFKKISNANLNLAESEKNVLTLKEENKRKKIIYISIGALLFLAVMFQGYFLRLRYQKKKISLELEKEYEFNKFRASLFINIAHEIRTPISLILGYLELSSQKSAPKEEISRYFNEIKRNSNKVINNISDIIYLLKENKTIEDLPLENINLEPFLRQLFFSFESIARIKNIELSYNVELPKNFIFTTNPNKLESLINNLVGNAIKFSPKNTTVCLECAVENTQLKLLVVDEGKGIDLDNQLNIFSKFYQEDKKGKSEGFGIGLAIVKDIVKRLSGNINVYSKLNKGTTFEIYLPVKESDTIEDSEEVVVNQLLSSGKEEDEVAVQSSKEHKLLIVEDNPYMVDYYKKILDPWFECVYAFNGEEGLQVLDKDKFDVIISDVMMPKMNGLEFRKRLKKLDGNKNTPFILVTALGYEENKIEAFNIGIDDYIVKPFGKNELIARIKCLIENKVERENWKNDFVVTEKETNEKVETFDQKSIKKLYAVVLDNLDKENFTVGSLATEFQYSQRQLERMIKKLTGLTPVKFILEVRLQEAYKKIKNREEADINNVRYSVGIKSASYFSVKFKQRFGVSPRDLLKEAS